MGPNVPSEAGPLLGDHVLNRELKVAPPLSVQFKLEYPMQLIVIAFLVLIQLSLTLVKTKH